MCIIISDGKGIRRRSITIFPTYLYSKGQGVIYIHNGKTGEVTETIINIGRILIKQIHIEIVAITCGI